MWLTDFFLPYQQLINSLSALKMYVSRRFLGQLPQITDDGPGSTKWQWLYFRHTSHACVTCVWCVSLEIFHYFFCDWLFYQAKLFKVRFETSMVNLVKKRGSSTQNINSTFSPSFTTFFKNGQSKSSCWSHFWLFWSS